MYEDKDPWPFKCPQCGEEFTEEIGRLKAQARGKNISAKCPGIIGVGPIRCPITVRYSAEQFLLKLAEAKAGRFDPFGTLWIRKSRP